MKENMNVLQDEQLNEVNGGLFAKGLHGNQGAVMADQKFEMVCPLCGQKLEFLGTVEDWNAMVEAHKLICPKK